MRVLGVSGSLRAGSHNAKLLRAAADLLPPEAELVVFDGLKAIAPYDEDDEASRPSSVQDLFDAVAAADVVLVSTPEYNHSIPGQLKNAFDWLSRPLASSPLRNKPVAVVGASTGMFGAVWAQAELRKVLGAMGGRVVEAELPVGHAKELLVTDRLELSPQQSEQLEETLAQLISEAEIESGLAVAA
jgi:chromate reductase